MSRVARTYRNVETDLWFSQDFRQLSQARPSGQGLWQYLLTSPRTVAVPGVVVARPAVMADDLRWSRRAFDAHMREVIAAGMAEIDAEVGLVVLTKALIVDGRVRESARPTSPRAVKAWANALLRLRSCALRDVVTARVERVMALIGGTFPSLFAEAMANPSTEDGECQGPSVEDSKDVSGNREQGTGIRIPEVSLSAGACASGAEPAPPAVASATEAAAPTTRGRDLFAALAEELHDRHAEEARKLKTAIPGCANVSVGGGPLMGEGRVAVIDVVSRWAAEARELGADTRSHVTARMNHLVAVRAATARKEKHLRWWTSGRFWRWAGIEIDLGQTVEQVRAAADKPRDGVRFAAERPTPAAAPAPTVAETARKLEEQRAAARKAAAERDAVAKELARAKEGLGIVDGLAKKLGGQR
jgi:hypothetical protein